MFDSGNSLIKIDESLKWFEGAEVDQYNDYLCYFF